MNNEHLEHSEACEALNEYIECLLAEKRGVLPAGLPRNELLLYVLAAKMKSIRPGADIPGEVFLAHLKASLDREIERRNRRATLREQVKRCIFRRNASGGSTRWSRRRS